MKIQTIWFLTIIMAMTFAGLLYVQIMYMRNMVAMRDDQFSEGVRRSLYAVAARLEQDETKHYLEEDLANIETSYLPQFSSDGAMLGTITSTFTTPQGVTGGITLSRDLNVQNPSLQGGKNSQQVLRELYRYQKGLLNEVVINILSQSGQRPVELRADSATVATYLRNELDNNGLDLPFEFALLNRSGSPHYSSAGYLPEYTRADNGDKGFSQLIFANDTNGRQNYIRLYFPKKMDYIFSSVRFLVPSFLFTLILLVVFLYTIIVAFRQKKVTEMKNDFINNMTHELKTPISSISLAGQMLNDTSVRKSETMMSHISSVINDETKRLRFLVEKVLQTSLYDRQKVMLRLTPVNANQVVDQVVKSFRLNVERVGGTITTHLDANDAEVTVDQMHFTNVIFNLLENAVKYRREDEPLRLTVTTSELSGNRLRISIEDNGMGLKRDDLKKIFDKFYRVGTGNRHDVKGFGLGLTYVKKIVTDLGGEISVESQGLGHGCRFNITLPLSE